MMPSVQLPSASDTDLAAASTTWVIVASRDHARRGVSDGFIMANHGKRAPLATMSPHDRIVIDSPTTTYPKAVSEIAGMRHAMR